MQGSGHFATAAGQKGGVIANGTSESIYQGNGGHEWSSLSLGPQGGAQWIDRLPREGLNGNDEYYENARHCEDLEIQVQHLADRSAALQWQNHQLKDMIAHFLSLISNVNAATGANNSLTHNYPTPPPGYGNQPFANLYPHRHPDQRSSMQPSSLLDPVAVSRQSLAHQPHQVPYNASALSRQPSVHQPQQAPYNAAAQRFSRGLDRDASSMNDAATKISRVSENTTTAQKVSVAGIGMGTAPSDNDRPNVKKARKTGKTSKAAKKISRVTETATTSQKMSDAEISMKFPLLDNVHPIVKNCRKAGNFKYEMKASDQLPCGWIVHIHQRKNTKDGTPANRVYDLYWFTLTGKKLRSHNEIVRFLCHLKDSNGDEDVAWKKFKNKVEPKSSVNIEHEGRRRYLPETTHNHRSRRAKRSLSNSRPKKKSSSTNLISVANDVSRVARTTAARVSSPQPKQTAASNNSKEIKSKLPNKESGKKAKVDQKPESSMEKVENTVSKKASQNNATVAEAKTTKDKQPEYSRKLSFKSSKTYPPPLFRFDSAVAESKT